MRRHGGVGLPLLIATGGMMMMMTMMLLLMMTTSCATTSIGNILHHSKFGSVTADCVDSFSQDSQLLHHVSNSDGCCRSSSGLLLLGRRF